MGMSERARDHNRTRSPLKLLLPLIVPVAAVSAYLQFGVIGLAVVAWVGLLLYWKIK